MRLSISFLVAALCAAAAGAGCGGGSSCSTAGNKICEKACACGSSDGKCHVGTGFTITFDTEADCKALFVNLGCSGSGDSNVDFEACSAALDTAQCVAQDPDMVLDIPEECNPPVDAGP